MPQRQVIASAMDVRHHSFDEFLEKHLDRLKNDLLLECERIASARELLLKKQLNDARRQIEELDAKLQSSAKTSADGGPQVHPIIQTQSNDGMVTTVLDLDQIEANVDMDASMETSPEEANPATSEAHCAMSEHFTMWGEWRDLVNSSSTSGSNIDHQIDFENEECDNGNDLTWERSRIHESSKKSWCSVSPNSAYVVCWEVLGIPVLFYDLVTIPMQVFHKPEGLLFDIIGWVLILYWTTDMLLRLLFIGYVTPEGMVKLERKVFMPSYLRTSFAFDFCMVAPDWFSKIIGAGGMRNVAILRLLRILRLMRLMRMSKMKKLFRDLEDAIDSEYFTVGVSIVVNLFAILGTCHYCACFWFWLGSIKIPGHPSWVDDTVRHAEWEYQYVMSLNWAVAQFTPGASQIQPVNIIEAVGAIAVLVFGLIFLSLFISALSQARTRLQAMTSKIDRDNWMLRRYLRQQGCTLDLQVRAMRYVEHCVEPTFSRVQRKDVFLLPLLSRPLQLEVQEEQYFHTLIAHPLLKNLRERSLSLTLHLFMNVVLEILLADADLLFEAGSIAHEVYFVSRGGIAYLHRGGHGIDYIDVGGWCCEAVLWVEWVHKGTAKAKEECTVISIDSAKLRSAVMEHKERAYVSRCASGYFKDLNALVDSGVAVTDMTNVTDNASSAYMQAIDGASEKSACKLVSL